MHGSLQQRCSRSVAYCPLVATKLTRARCPSNIYAVLTATAQSKAAALATTAGEVVRSATQQQQQQQQRVSTQQQIDDVVEVVGAAGHSKPSVLSSSLLIAGNTIGAGMLALPAVTQEAGFGAAVIALSAGCLFSCISGLILAEVNLRILASRGGASAGGQRLTLASMAKETLGGGATIITSSLFVFRSYALLQAYLSRAGALISRASHLPMLPSAALFACACAAVCAASSNEQLDRLSTGLVVLMLATFTGLLYTIGGGNSLDLDVLSTAPNWSALPAAIPIIALSFIFQNSVPLVVTNLECDAPKIRKAIVLGSLLPLGMFVLWEAAILGSAHPAASGFVHTIVGATTRTGSSIQVTAQHITATAHNAALTAAAATQTHTDPLMALQAGQPAIGNILLGFSLITLSCSSIAYTQSLSDFFSEVLHLPSNGSGQRSLLPYLLVVAPPLTLAVLYPDAFVMALSLAGTYGAMILYALIPAAMAWQSRRNGFQPIQPTQELASTSSLDLVSEKAVLTSLDLVSEKVVLMSMDAWSSLSSLSSIDLHDEPIASCNTNRSSHIASSDGSRLCSSSSASVLCEDTTANSGSNCSSSSSDSSSFNGNPSSRSSYEERCSNIGGGSGSSSPDAGRGNVSQAQQVMEMVPGGNGVLLLVWLGGAGVIVNQLVSNFNGHW